MKWPCARANAQGTSAKRSDATRECPFVILLPPRDKRERNLRGFRADEIQTSLQLRDEVRPMQQPADRPYISSKSKRGRAPPANDVSRRICALKYRTGQFRENLNSYHAESRDSFRA
jgi:hypothetical protein